MSSPCVEAPLSLIDQAKRYADLYGWACIPVRGKQASSTYKRFFNQAPSRQQMYGMFRLEGTTGVAIIPGKPSNGLRVRDYDNVDAYGRWSKAHPDLATSLPTVKTPHGYHVYFNANTPDKVTRYEDGEFRGGNCYVVAPPSEHPDGGRYEWMMSPGDCIPFIENVEEAGLVGPAPVAPPSEAEVPQSVAVAITQTLPSRTGQRNNKVFEFVRRLKAIADLDTSFDAMQSYIREWHRQALPFIKSKEFHVTEQTFFDAWRDAKTPLADDNFRALVNEALNAPDPTWYRNLLLPDGSRKLLKVGMALQQSNKDEQFFLSSRKAAEIINVDPTHACRLLNGLEKNGYLKCIAKGTFKQGKDTDDMGTVWAYTGKQV